MKNLFLCFALTISTLNAVSQTYEWSWNVLGTPPIGNFYNFDDIKFVNDTVAWVCDIAGNIYKTSDGGLTWSNQKNQSGTSFRCLAFIDDQKGFAGTLGPGSWVNSTSDTVVMYSTIDGGDNWIPVTNIPNNLPIKGLCGMQTVGNNTIFAVGRYDGPAVVLKTTDAGANWVSYDTDGLAESLVDVHFFDNDTGLVCGRDLNDSSIILYTTDGGENFTTVANEVGDHIWKLFFLDRYIGYAQISIYNSGSRYFMKTVDGGLTWSKVFYTTDEFVGLGIGFFNESIGWAAGEGEFTYETRDGGATWDKIRMDNGNYDDTGNRFVKGPDSTLYAIGRRIYKYEKTLVPDSISTHISSHPNYVDNSKCKISFSPNPFSGEGKIAYTVPEDGHVTILITSIGGRKIEYLVNKKMKAGDYTLDYNPSYNQKYVGCIISIGNYRKSVVILRPGGNNAPRNY